MPPRCICPLLLVLAGTLSARGEVVTDATFGARTVISKSGQNYPLPASLGRQQGGNLFHSFQKFDLVSGETATFSGTITVKNIIARITGGKSDIDGTIRSEISGANLYLLNPSGFLFRENAAFDVTGAVAVSTAGEVRFNDGGAFPTRAGETPTLTSAPVSAFGFLSPSPASVVFQGSSISANEGTGFHLIAGDVTIDEGAAGPSALSAPGGRLTIFSVGSAGRVPFDGDTMDVGSPATKFASMGQTQIRGQSQLSVDSSNGGGRILIRSGKLVVAGGSSITALNSGSARGGNIHIGAEDFSISGFSSIEAAPTADGTGGDIAIRSGSLTVETGSSIRTPSSADTGAGGNVIIEASGPMALRSAANISTTSSSQHPSGSLTLQAQSLSIEGFDTTIRSDRSYEGDYDGVTFSSARGLMDLRVTDSLRLAKGATISASTLVPAPGANVIINAGRLEIDGRGRVAETSLRVDSGVFDPSGAAPRLSLGGKLELTLGDLSMTGGGVISASSFAGGQSGHLTVNASGSIAILNGSSITASASSTGNSGDVAIDAETLTLQNGGRLITATQGSADAGSLRVRATSIVIDGRGAAPGTVTGMIAQSRGPDDGRPGSIFVDTSNLRMLGGAVIEATTGSANNAGTVTVQANNILLDGSGATLLPGSPALPLATAISARSVAGASGRGGNVSVTASDTITLLNRGEIEAATEGLGAGGNVTVRAARLVADGSSFGFPSGVLARGAVGASGPAGTVDVRAAESIHLSNGATIASNHLGSGVAGSVRVSAGREVRLADDASITAASRLANAGTVSVISGSRISLESGSEITASAGTNGGNVFLQARDLLYLTESRIIAEANSTRTGGGTGGNIEIDPEYVIFDRSLIDASATAGRGGNIRIQAENFLTSSTPITATGSTAGTVEISAPVLGLDSALAALAARVIDGSVRLQERCVMRLGLEVSSFLAIGRGGVAEAPDGPQQEIAARVLRKSAGNLGPR